MGFKSGFAAAICLFFASAAVADSQFQRMANLAQSAYNNGDHGLAVRVWRQIKDRAIEKELVGRDQVVDEAIVSLARMYVSGKGVLKDPGRAIEIAMIAARRGDTGAQGFIAERYYQEKNYEEAFFWALLASRRKNPRWEGLKFRVGLRLDESEKQSIVERADPWMKRGGVDPSV